MKKIIAFIDEFGTNSLNIEKEGVTSHYILCAILIKEENLNKAREVVKLVRENYFQGSEIKSSKVKKKHHDRRLTILKELSNIEFNIYMVIVDKSEVKSQGLSIKNSFYKYFNKELVKNLNRINKKITFIADKVGTEEFQKSLEEYIETEVSQIDLFNEEKIYEFKDSEDEVLIQLSDFVVGSLAKFYNTKTYFENSIDFVQMFKNRLNINYWPYKISNYTKEIKGLRKIDHQIAELTLNSADNYIENNKHKGDIINVTKIHLLKHFILLQEISPFYFLQTHEIIEKIERDLGHKLSIRQLRKEIIGSLRDNHVIISSSNSGGYKLPVNESDLLEFVNKYNSIIQPMLSRMKKCRENIMLGSLNEIDILKYPEFQYLKSIVEMDEKKL